MALTSKDINALYITLFNRIAEGDGQQYWLNVANKSNLEIKDVAAAMLATGPSKEYFSGKESNEDFINHIYTNLFSKDKSKDPEGVAFWAKSLYNGNSREVVVSELLKAAEHGNYSDTDAVRAQNLYLNKLKVAEVGAKIMQKLPEKGTQEQKLAAFSNILKEITDTSTAAEVATAIKTQALVNNVKTVENQEFAKIIAGAFEGTTQEQIERVLEDLGKNGNFMYREITDNDGFMKLVSGSDVGVKAEGVDYAVYKGIDGKYYKDEGGKKVVADISLAKLKISSVKLPTNEIYTFKKPVTKSEEVLKSYTVQSILKEKKEGDVLTIDKSSMLFGADKNISELLTDMKTLVTAYYSSKIYEFGLPENVNFRVLDTPANLQQKGVAEVLALLGERIKSVDVNQENSLFEINISQFKSLKSKFTSASDETKAIANFGMFKDSLALKENVLLKDSIANFKAALENSSDLNTLKAANSIDITDEQGVLDLSLVQYSLLKDKFSDTNDSLQVLDVTGAVAASKAKDIFSLSANASNLTISDFSNDDKINFKNLGINEKVEAQNLGLAANAGKEIKNGNIYSVKMDENIAGKDYGGKDFAELIAESGKAFKNTTSNQEDTKAVVAVQGKDITQLYKIVADGNGTLESSEISLIGVITAEKDGASIGAELNEQNILID
ncbi:DUF4214 domain-containing protein [Campylobacter sp. Marseille-Q3452]|uniref:DUF4214 domain-containing protein n=1 Tax=Campylobacter massiliensis TaxID=2762557 RepID=A0A842J6F4_9BACT|nr:DUF4214 domain-containing protein [Campylobacter massiliensis]MBC2882155.1 DUF4214 domain-containing protein [Campylobacter massiliensis]